MKIESSIRSGALLALLLAAACAHTPPESVATAAPARLAADARNFRVGPSSVPVPVTAGACRNMEGFACVVTISVTAGCAGNDMLVVPNPLYTVVERKVPVPILFRIETPDWGFAPKNGIWFKRNPGGEMQDWGPRGANEWVWFDQALNRGLLSYEINVQNSRTGEVCRRDPAIVNDW